MTVYIRPIEITDADISYKWRNNPEIWKYTFNKPNIEVTPEIEKNWIEKVLLDEHRKTFAICILETNQYIGNIQLTDIKDNEGLFGIFIGEKKYWNKGIGKNAIKLLLEYAKNILKLNKVFLNVKKDNIAAIKCYISCGFVQTEILNETDIKMEINL